jgi:acetylornithine/succinyldiaminopimelate/putrescine aminotransferase
MEGSFHGRTMAGIAATGQEKVKKGFEPMVAGFKHVPFNNLDAVRAAVGPQTAAILVEPIQGESGIRPATPEYLRGLRQLCDEKNLLLLFDEVQCGNGRTGKFFGFQAIAPDVTPDAFSMAKGIGGGFPIGAIWTRAARKVKTADGEKPLCDILGPGTHASTFGGTPLACAVALAVIHMIEEKNLMAKAVARSKRLKRGLKALRTKFSCIKEVRGLGLMLGIELDREVKDVVAQCAAAGLLVVPAGTHTLRFVPPLTISNADADAALAIVEKVLGQLS